MAIARYKIKTLDGDVAYGDGAGFVFPGSGTSWAVVFHTETEGDYTVSWAASTYRWRRPKIGFAPTPTQEMAG